LPTSRPSPDLDMHYEVDDFTDPWRRPETILLLHGNAESGLAWWAWVPALARHYHVVRPDMRGFGRSTAMPRDYPWTLDRLVEDFTLLMDHLGIDRFHLVGAKIGGTVARAFAARRPQRVRALTVLAPPPPLGPGPPRSPPGPPRAPGRPWSSRRAGGARETGTAPHPPRYRSAPSPAGEGRKGALLTLARIAGEGGPVATRDRWVRVKPRRRGSFDDL